jgi:thiol-disulfide isomerase/thioredoxin
MNYIMKQLFFTGLICLLLAACGQTGSNEKSNVAELPGNDARVQVYYFHGKQRCVTCVTLQKVAEEAVKENFGTNKDVAFVEIDFSEKANEALAEKYEIVFSSLIIASGDDFKDITDDSFAMVMRNPDGLKALITKETNAFLN